jgi:hypothetical protein
MRILIEATVVGIFLALFVWLMKFTKFDYCKNEIVFMFFTGFFIHLVFEMLKLNKWYCKNGVACTN